MVLIAMKPPSGTSVGMLARNSTLALNAVGDGVRTLIATLMPVPGPGSRAGRLVEDTHGVAPSPVMVTFTWIGTPVCVVPVSGFVQLVVPAQVATFPPLMPLKVRACCVASRPAVGRALEDDPQ